MLVASLLWRVALKYSILIVVAIINASCKVDSYVLKALNIVPK